MKTMIALQLWSLREDCKRDFAATVNQVARMGYDGVETAGYGNLDAPGAAAAIEAAGLHTIGMHVGFARLRDELPAVVEEAGLLKTRHVVCSYWDPTAFTDAPACEAIGEALNAVGEQLRMAGLQFHFHNHQGEMKQIDGRTVLEWITGASEPRNLGLELDVGWVHFGGQSPVRLLHAFGARTSLIHLRDDAEIGAGPVEFAPVFAAARAIGAVEAYIVEQGQYNHPPLESVRISLEQLRRWGL